VPDAAPVPAATPSRPARRRASWAVLVLALPAAAVAFLAGLLIGPRIGPDPGPAPTVGAAELPVPVVTKASPDGALGLLARTQRAADRPSAVPAQSGLVAASFRRLAALPGPGVVLYGARTTGKQVCLVAVAIDEHLTATCASAADFRGTPFSLDLSVAKDPASDDPKDTRTEIAATWSWDGSLRAGAVA